MHMILLFVTEKRGSQCRVKKRACQ
jgi:hypothetical protein